LLHDVNFKKVLSKFNRLVPRGAHFADVVGTNGSGKIDVGEASVLEKNLRAL
jgi:hypothetical protein